ncbi:hypothetical protein C8R43DRAFT_951860 [Mycena crocata]|nr:hypothetical protein C8R43DRAFT_951860 [Mycena crocata]
MGKRKRRNSPDEDSDLKAARRRDASRRYYARQPSRGAREKRPEDEGEKAFPTMTIDREAKKLYRRQWDPPRKPARKRQAPDSIGEDAEATDEGAAHSSSSIPKDCYVPLKNVHLDYNVLSEPSDGDTDEVVAQTVLTKMFCRADERKPMSLTAIDVYESSSESHVSQARESTPCLPPTGKDPEVAARIARRAVKLEATRARIRQHQDAEREAEILQAERAARMNIHVRTSAASEEVYHYRGSVGVASWLRSGL